MTEEQYKTYAQVIVVGREYISFNHNTISSVMGLTPHRAGSVIKKLLELKCIKRIKTEQRKRTRPIDSYAIKHDAITRLRNRYEKERLANLPVKSEKSPVAKKPRKIMNDFLCGPVFVKKANTAGMGNSMLMRLDSLLSEVRV